MGQDRLNYPSNFKQAPQSLNFVDAINSVRQSIRLGNRGLRPQRLCGGDCSRCSLRVPLPRIVEDIIEGANLVIQFVDGFIAVIAIVESRHGDGRGVDIGFFADDFAPHVIGFASDNSGYWSESSDWGAAATYLRDLFPEIEIGNVVAGQDIIVASSSVFDSGNNSGCSISHVADADGAGRRERCERIGDFDHHSAGGGFPIPRSEHQTWIGDYRVESIVDELVYNLFGFAFGNDVAAGCLANARSFFVRGLFPATDAESIDGRDVD